MKILHVLDHSIPLHSGYTFRSHNIFKTQKGRGWELVVVTSPKHEASWKGKSSAEESFEGITYYRTGAVNASRVPFVTEGRIINALARKIEAVAVREKPNILHAHSPVLNAIAALRAGKKLGLPVVYDIRAFWEDAAVDHGTYAEGSWKYRLTKRIETSACHRVHHVAILCNGLKNDLVSRGIPERKVTPVFNGVNLDDFKPSPPDNELRQQWGLEGKQVFGFIGSFYHYEGLDLLVRAFAPIAAENPKAMLLLVGGGEMAQRLTDMVCSLGLERRVIMPGRIPHERIPYVYALIDVLVYPRYSMRLTELVTPLKPLEAMAMEKVVVASDVGGHKELISDGETGVLFRAGEEEDLTAKLRSLLSQHQSWPALACRAVSHVRACRSWEATTAAYGEMYSSALGLT